jgi:hypothetical protein
LNRLEPEEYLGISSAQSAYAEPIVPAAGDAGAGSGSLPHDHPRWVKDSLAVSQRARELIARLRPIVVNVLTFWDHRVRSSIVTGLRVCIDPSGSYRLDGPQ